MLKKKVMTKNGTVKVTFVLPSDDARLPASVVGEFNDWDHSSHPLRKRNNDTHSVSVSLKKGSRVAFRYRSHSGEWFNEENADDYEKNEMGTENCIVVAE